MEHKVGSTSWCDVQDLYLTSSVWCSTRVHYWDYMPDWEKPMLHCPRGCGRDLASVRAAQQILALSLWRAERAKPELNATLSNSPRIRRGTRRTGCFALSARPIYKASVFTRTQHRTEEKEHTSRTSQPHVRQASPPCPSVLGEAADVEGHFGELRSLRRAHIVTKVHARYFTLEFSLSKIFIKYLALTEYPSINIAWTFRRTVLRPTTKYL